MRPLKHQDYLTHSFYKYLFSKDIRSVILGQNRSTCSQCYKLCDHMLEPAITGWDSGAVHHYPPDLHQWATESE